MFAATRRWFQRNRTPLAIGAGIVGAGYVATQYVLSRLNDARERMSSDRIAKENLRRRFEQNQEDCTFTVLALLPSATAAILKALDTEAITYEIQSMKARGSANKGPATGTGTLSSPSIADTNLTEDDGARSSLAASTVQSESGIHASQVTLPPVNQEEGSQDGGAAGVEQQQQQQPQTQQQQKPKKTKRQLWHDLIISSITRSFTLIYTLALLTMLTRIQLNLLGRRSYLSSVISLAASASGAGSPSGPISLENNDDDSPVHAYGSDFETNRKYLAFSWWLLNRGWCDLRIQVEEAVRAIFGELSPRDILTFQRFAELTLEVRRRVEGATPDARRRNPAWLGYLLPTRADEDEVIRASGILEEGEVEKSTVDLGSAQQPPSQLQQGSPVSLRRLLDETADLIESPAFAHVLTLLLDSGFSELVDNRVATLAFGIPPQGDKDAAPRPSDHLRSTDDMLVGGAPLGTILPPEEAEEASQLRTTKAVQLPRILSVLTRQAHLVGNGMPNEYLSEMERVRDLESFAAVVYSSNWENEVMNEEGALAGSGSTADVRAAEVNVGPGASDEVQMSGAEVAAAAAGGLGEESVVVVDSQTFESAWGRAVEGK
ncbi:hypothetical protein ACRALDRAFT_1058186 [Sodiomyces alcalophilus JCM 7366]|uniref:uncharacterized protein n=1 Tax=Sodiomyces alcalophilus JCM 7366 TaxID=591952 RepID=UPI0039B6B72B